ncbi:hypothetical protein TNCV_1912031 [Trichonephila clavipes]|nr:hypothetical protein TNCV_1912031 [Trichonephila clavipes]
MLSTDQQSRKPSHHTARTYSVNCLIVRHQYKGITLTMGFCVKSCQCKAPGGRTVTIAVLITCSAIDPHSPSPPFGVRTANEWVRSSSATKPHSILVVMIIVWRPVVNASILPLTYTDSLCHKWCDDMGNHHIRHMVIPYIDPWHHDSSEVRS